MIQHCLLQSYHRDNVVHLLGKDLSLGWCEAPISNISQAFIICLWVSVSRMVNIPLNPSKAQMIISKTNIFYCSNSGQKFGINICYLTIAELPAWWREVGADFELSVRCLQSVEPRQDCPHRKVWRQWRPRALPIILFAQLQLQQLDIIF